MEFVALGILTAVAVALITRPLFSRKKYLFYLEDVFAMGDARQLTYLEGRKQNILDNLKELDFEHEMGKLSEGDYERLRSDYLVEAEEVVKAIDKLKVQAEIEDLIENEARQRRHIR